jgi:ribosomal protein L20A (L18A)
MGLTRTFRVKGNICKPNYAMPFSKDVQAVKVKDAIEKVYADLGSHHKVKRVHINIISVNELSSNGQNEAS